MEGLSVRQYAEREGMSIGGVYRRLWEGRVKTKRLDGRWLIAPESNHPESEGARAHSATGAGIGASK